MGIGVPIWCESRKSFENMTEIHGLWTVFYENKKTFSFST